MRSHSLQGLTRRTLAVLLLAGASHDSQEALAYLNNAQWTATATNGPVGAGSPITLTWGVAVDGTTVPNVTPGVNRASNLVARLDAWYGAGQGGADLATRPWFGLLSSSLGRWAEVSGLRFVYQPADDGATLGPAQGALGVRADVRLAGGRYDGTVGTNVGTLGYTIAPNNGDIFLDTDDIGYFGDPSGDSFRLRHTLMHEVGHALGLGHVISDSAPILLEPFPQTAFDGPQIDDIRGAQWLFGDAWEKDGGNNTDATATPLGTLSIGGHASIGADGGATLVTPGMTDFLSIHRSTDIDVFSIGFDALSSVEVTLTPVGGAYDQRTEGGATTTIQASRVGNLALAARRDGATLRSSDAGGFGSAEAISLVAAPGDLWTLRVSGLVGATQLYRLDVAVAPLTLEGDYNHDGSVDAADYTRWRDALGGSGSLAADGDGDGVVDGRDFAIWTSTYGNRSQASGAAVPEPPAGALAGAAAIACRLVASGRRRWL